MALTDRARVLRKNQTDPERWLWFALRNRRFLGVKFRRQCPVGPYVVDFICEEKKLIVELDGGQHNDAIAKDRARDEFLREKGYDVFRVWNHDFWKNRDAVMKAIEGKILKPSPGLRPPSPEGRGNNTRGN